MSRVVTEIVAEDEEGIRLDRWFKHHFPDLTHGRLQKLLRTGQVRIDGKRAKASARLEAGQSVRVPPLQVSATAKPARQEPEISKPDAKDLQGRILHRDDHVIVLNKAPGLAVQGGTKTHHHLDAMLDVLKFGLTERPRLVHRLDKDTSGVLVLARTAPAARALTAAFRTKDARKLYWAVVAGVPKPLEGKIDLKLEKKPTRSSVMSVEKMTGSETGKKAVTLYRVVEKAGRKAAWLALEPLTGRTHQLRVHAAALGTPILGDGKYGGREAFLDGAGISKKLHLHARAILIPHPAGGMLEAMAPLPDHMRETWDFLGFDENSRDASFLEQPPKMD